MATPRDKLQAVDWGAAARCLSAIETVKRDVFSKEVRGKFLYSRNAEASSTTYKFNPKTNKKSTFF